MSRKRIFICFHNHNPFFIIIDILPYAHLKYILRRVYFILKLHAYSFLFARFTCFKI